MLKTIPIATFIIAVGIAQSVSSQPPRVAEAVAPGYPLLPSGGRESGDVQVEVAISTSGEVASATAISGPERLRSAAERAARKWRFVAQDKPTEKWLITFGFKLIPELGEPLAVATVFKEPSCIDVFAEQKQIVTLSNPPFEDLDKSQKKKY